MQKLDCKRWKFWILSWVSLAQSLVEILTFGFYVPSWRGHVLFSVWVDE